MGGILGGFVTVPEVKMFGELKELAHNVSLNFHVDGALGSALASAVAVPVSLLALPVIFLLLVLLKESLADVVYYIAIVFVVYFTTEAIKALVFGSNQQLSQVRPYEGARNNELIVRIRGKQGSLLDGIAAWTIGCRLYRTEGSGGKYSDEHAVGQGIDADDHFHVVEVVKCSLSKGEFVRNVTFRSFKGVSFTFGGEECRGDTRQVFKAKAGFGLTSLAVELRQQFVATLEPNFCQVMFR
eukprot:c8486_g1_i1.p1 GENE.c8486_g1_i1~~c8486_g1_i1.p1  ORF type:complete len:241 (-),score=21.85 c8486_g1_i1:26-748(-)